MTKKNPPKQQKTKQKKNQPQNTTPNQLIYVV